jgi:hypothetical protein
MRFAKVLSGPVRLSMTGTGAAAFHSNHSANGLVNGSLQAESSRCTHAGAVFAACAVRSRMVPNLLARRSAAPLARLADHDQHRMASMACAR